MKRSTYDGFLTKADDPQAFTKADGEAGELAGYASKFWEVDSYGECTAPGCFTKSITERGPKSASNRILFRYEHFVTVGKHTDMTEDDTGLKIDAQISDDGQDGTRLRRHLNDGIPYGLSIGFRKIKARPGTADDPFDMTTAPSWLTKSDDGFDPGLIVVLEEAKLLENSAVSFPAVDSALITNYRSDIDLDQRAIDLLMADAKRGVLTDDHVLLLRAFAQSLPAASGPAPEMGQPVVTQTAVLQRRNYMAEARLALSKAGLSVWETAQHGNSTYNSA